MTSADNPAPKETSNKKRFITLSLQVLLSTIVLGCGVALAAYYLKTGPEAKPRKREPTPSLVEVKQINYASHRLTINGMGTVLAAKEINLTPGVGGEIISMSDKMVPGGLFAKDDVLANIDPVDYELTVKRLQSEVAKVRNELELEMGNQRISQKEFELLGQEVSEAEKKLMLREPQLAMQKATLEGVKANLAQAELNLKRTRIKAPFNGVVLSRSVNIGTRVSESTVLARLVGTDEFWLKLALPIDQLKWVTFPTDDTAQQGSRVRIFLHQMAKDGSFLTGRVIRLAADVEEQGRMAAVYVSIKDPLSLLPENRGKPQLLLGSFVRAEIEGRQLASVIAISRDYLHGGENVWLMKGDNTLEIRDVDIVAKNNDLIFIGAGLADGEKLIVSDLSSPVAGIPLKLMPRGIKGQEEDRTAAAANDSWDTKKEVVH
ncbi:MAG: efflux RND transporter periplasmic adaptor subunit [Desulforhopalus sp.]